MPTYLWTEKTKAGSLKKAEMQATSMETIRAKLRSQNILSTRVKTKPKERSFKFGGDKVTEKDVVVFTHQFSTMIDAGEVGGVLEVILQRLANYKDKAASLKKKVKSAVVYPTSILTVAMQ